MTARRPRRIGICRPRSTDRFRPGDWLLGPVLLHGFLPANRRLVGGGKTTSRSLSSIPSQQPKACRGARLFRRSHVLIVSLEDGEDELRRTRRAAMLRHGVNADEIKGSRLFSPQSAPRLEARHAERRPFCPGAFESRLIETIEAPEHDVLILDPFVESPAPLKENADAPINISGRHAGQDRHRERLRNRSSSITSRRACPDPGNAGSRPWCRCSCRGRGQARLHARAYAPRKPRRRIPRTSALPGQDGQRQGSISRLHHLPSDFVGRACTGQLDGDVSRR